ncbi:MAG: hypothetical protein KJN78_03210 [Gammaproteobacteria bacterium]|nr:hypothetical protein [Gammaproteobacteria bacterium]
MHTDGMTAENPEQPPANGRRREWWLLVLLVALVALSSFSPIDRIAEREYEGLFQRALVTFALARTLNGVISAVQGTELALQPAGVGVTLTPGEVLDPVNDLIERFSWIMLGATLSLGVQQVLLDVGQWWGIKLMVALMALAWLGFRWHRRRRDPASEERLETFLLRSLLLLLFLRFAVPIAMIANEAVYELFLDDRYQESTRVIESAGDELEKATAPAPEEDGEAGLFDALGRGLDSTRESLDFKAKLALVGERTSEMIEHFLQLAVVFIFQTGILPIAFLWLFLQLFRQIFQNKN